jgi:septal ring factor EnvC (AmiA/AmiB activator)
MTSPGRGLVTGAVVASVVLAGGVAVASSLNAAEASTTSADQTVGDLQAQLAQLQGDTVDLNHEITAASAALSDAQKAQAAREAAAARAATAARIARSRAALHVSTTRNVTKKSTVKAHTAPKSHTSTGASGSSSGGDDHEAEGGSDD